MVELALGFFLGTTCCLCFIGCLCWVSVRAANERYAMPCEMCGKDSTGSHSAWLDGVGYEINLCTDCMAESQELRNRFNYRSR